MTNLPKRYPLNYRSIIPALMCIMILLPICGIGIAASEPKKGPLVDTPTIEGSLEFIAPDSRILATITIEFSETPKDWSKGLMDRREMDPMHGMLFIFDQIRPRGFWMRNTYIPLDIIFIDESRRVVTIAENTVPFSERILSSKKPVKYVVEVNAGFSKRFNIEKGMQVRWQRR
jgi:uncharacterized membrane protein (UPF0127 family)